jgi:hypothetical protein
MGSERTVKPDLALCTEKELRDELFKRHVATVIITEVNLKVGPDAEYLVWLNPKTSWAHALGLAVWAERVIGSDGLSDAVKEP